MTGNFPMDTGPDKIAIWIVTLNGIDVAMRIEADLPITELFYTRRLMAQVDHGQCVQRLTDVVAREFKRYSGHIFIMSTGIVVRSIASSLKHKTADPAVVVVDDRAQYAISLISGHIGGANQLAHEVAAILGATPIITTATDVNHKPAIDMLAKENRLSIENPQAIKQVNMALLTGEPIRVHDPAHRLGQHLPGAIAFYGSKTDPALSKIPAKIAGVYIDDIHRDLPSNTLVLRPASLVAGIGCNRDTPKTEIRDFLFKTMSQFGLAPGSLFAIATIDLKVDEIGLVDLAADLKVSIHFFSKDKLNQVEDVPTPSTQVLKHVGVKSVCEAAAILASRNGQLIVPKQNTRNVTVAIARQAFTSSVSVPAP